MNDFGLDLAVIGNGRTAALVDPSSGIVWWCYPRFDGDPIFSCLLAGGEEKGSCDVVLQGMVDFSSEYVRSTAIVSTGPDGRQGRIDPDYGFRAAVSRIRPHLSPAATHADHRAGRRSGLEREARRLPSRNRDRRSRRQRAVAARDRVRGNRDPRFVRTVKAIERELLRDKHVMRYASEDDFGLPGTAFLICRFWRIDVLWDLVRREQAREMFNDALRYRNRYRLLADDIHPRESWGNFPQTYSMAGLILTAMQLSRSWEDRFWRG
jgi:hypothetical protein